MCKALLMLQSQDGQTGAVDSFVLHLRKTQISAGLKV
jgi:hypothetical protein